MGRNSGYRRDYGRPQNGLLERNGGMAAGGGGAGSPEEAARGHPADVILKETSEVSGMLSGLEKRLSGVKEDFNQAIHKISEKDNEKFDLIFAILSELQQRQANLEESVRSLKAQCGNGCWVPGPSSQLPQPQQQQLAQPQQFANSGSPSQYGQMNGQIGVQQPMQPVQNGNAGNQQPMQQFTGVLPDGTQGMFTAMPAQQMIIMSPPNGGMQYTAVPQMMAPTGTVVQQMPAPMAMQFIAQGTEMGVSFANGNGQQDSQAEVSTDKVGWQPDNSQNHQDASEGLNSTASGTASSDTSSNVGKVDDGSPER